MPALQRVSPELVIFSAGFDAHAEDDMAMLRFSDADYAWVTEQLKAVADQHAGGRMVSMLEGGYALSGARPQRGAAHQGDGGPRLGPMTVAPAKAGAHFFFENWVPAFAETTSRSSTRRASSADRLHQVLVEAGVARALAVRLAAQAGERDEGHVAEREVLPQPPHHAVAVDAGHADVEQHDLRPEGRAPPRAPPRRRARSAPRSPARPAAGRGSRRRRRCRRPPARGGARAPA